MTIPIYKVDSTEIGAKVVGQLVELVTLADHTQEVKKLTDQVTRLLQMYETLEKELARNDQLLADTFDANTHLEERLRVLMQSIAAKEPVKLSDTPMSDLLLGPVASP